MTHYGLHPPPLLTIRLAPLQEDREEKDTMRRASCIVLTRQGRSTGQDAEVFLIKRSPELKFLGGFHAFAGGGVEDEVDEEVLRSRRQRLGYRLLYGSSSRSLGSL